MKKPHHNSLAEIPTKPQNKLTLLRRKSRQNQNVSKVSKIQDRMQQTQNGY